MKELNIDRMPTSIEVRNSRFTGLSSAIERSGGYPFWAARLGLGTIKRVTKWNDNLIESEIRKSMQILNIERMPTASELNQVNSSLSSAIQKHGGFYFWSEKLRIDNKTQEVDWNDDQVRSELKRVISGLKLDRMPSAKEVVDFCGNSALHAYISKTRGYRSWASEFGLELKESETQLGQDWEINVGEILICHGYKIEQMSTKHPFDILVNNYVKIDVKCGRAYRDPSGYRVHTFGINKKYASCDIYIVAALSEDGSLERLFVIPSHFARLSTTMTIGQNSKYNKYVDRFDYIEQYEEFYKSIK